MSKKWYGVILTAIVVVPLVLYGCKGKTEKPQEPAVPETEMAPTPVQGQEEVVNTQPIEPSQTVAAEPIPATSTGPVVGPAETKPAVAPSKDKAGRGMDIQRALKAANFYNGPVDGKIGPKTKRAIEAFQKEKGLKPDGKVGPKTWVELEKYLSK